MCSIYNLGVVRRFSVGVLDEIFFTDISPPTTPARTVTFRNAANVRKVANVNVAYTDVIILFYARAYFFNGS